MYRDLGCATYPTDGIRVSDSASLKLYNADIRGGFGVGLFVDTHGTVEVFQTRILDGCRDYSLQAGIVWQPTQLNLELSASSFFGQVFHHWQPWHEPHARDSEFYGARGVLFEGSRNRTYDFGTAASPGGNTLWSAATYPLFGLDIDVYSNIVVDASGNRWIPNEQGADAEGHYPADAALVLRNTAGPNIRVYDPSSVRL